MIAERRDEIGDFYYENYDRTSVNSLEANFNFQLNKINYELNYNFSRVIDEIQYNRLPDISEHIINFNISKNFKYNIAVLGNINYYGKKTITAPTSGTEIFVPSYYQSNFSIVKNGFFNKPYFKDINLKLAINNLFNYTNFDDTTFQNPGRTYFMEVSFKYDFK